MAQDHGLRELFLHGSVEELGVEVPETPWLIVMETGVEGGSYTVMAIYDGTTSIYFSNGGGIIGAGEHPEIASKSRSLVSSISNFSSHFSSVKSADPPPQSGQTVFYYRSGVNLFHVEAPEKVLRDGGHSLSPLFYAVHDLVGAVRQRSPQDDD